MSAGSSPFWPSASVTWAVRKRGGHWARHESPVRRVFCGGRGALHVNVVLVVRSGCAVEDCATSAHLIDWKGDLV